MALGPPKDAVWSDTRAPAVLVLTCVFTSISVVTTAIRLYVRTRQRQLGWDDLAITLGVIFTILSWPFTILAVKSGYGHHVNLLTKQQASGVLRWLFLIEFDLFFTLPLTKISICCFILRIKNTGWLRWFLYSMMVLLAITNLIPMIVLCAQCQPVQAYWDRTKGKCWGPTPYTIAVWIGVSYNIFSDLACTFLPVVVLWNVRIKPYMKYLISALMGIGLIATACGAVRAYLSKEFHGSPDLTYDLTIINDWGVMEAHFAVIGANLALARYVWLWIWPKKEKSSSGYSSGYAGGSNPLNNRRSAYTNIGKGPRHAHNAVSQDSILPLDQGQIRATTDIELTVRPPSRPPSRSKRSDSSLDFAV